VWPSSNLASLALIVFFLLPARAAQRYPVSGLVVQVDRPNNTLVVSSDAIPGYMDAMVMPYSVRDPKQLDSMIQGVMVEFTLVVEEHDSYAENIRIRHYESVEQEPLQARRLKILEGLSGPPPVAVLDLGQRVPDFTLPDQNKRQISLRGLEGRVVAVNFVYTRCPLPQYCVRMVNNFGHLQKRFRDRLGRDLVLLTISFDPIHDQPAVLAEYASSWKADSTVWHFLTGPEAEVSRVCGLFGLGFWRDEATFTHSLRTAVIDRKGRLVANLEGNQFTSEQLGDLVQAVLDRPTQ
jgi:protein SCO1